MTSLQIRRDLLVAAVVACARVYADEIPAPYNTEPAGAAPVSAAESLAMMKMPEGFTATIFAAEPEIQNPIAATWDHRGRLWVAENYTYAERQKRFDLALRDRLVILEDKDHDGKAETRKVFGGPLEILTSVEVGRGGVWVMCPPRLLFIPDADGDDVPDGEPQVILDGFTIAKDNYHNLANGLRWGLDGWLYGRCGHSCPGSIGAPDTPESNRIPIKGGFWRYHPERKTVEVLTQGTVNPWGHDWDRHGEGFFINTVIGHLWHLIPGAHHKESGAAVSPNPDIYERMDMCADHWHYDTSGKWQDSRDGAANDLGGGHAHVGAAIYQADQWPPNYRDRLFTLNFHGRRANAERLERTGSGYVGKHEPDPFIWGDPWFRGQEFTVGPEGSAYVLDWSDTGECHDHTGVHRTSGRIFRVTYGTPAPPDTTDLRNLSAAGAERMLRSPNVWFDRQLRIRLMSSPPSPEISRRLAQIAMDRAEDTVIRLRALWTAYTTGSIGRDSLVELLSEKDEHLRVWGIRLLTDEMPIDSLAGPAPTAATAIDPALLEKFIRMAAQDPSGLVKLTLSSTLQRLPVTDRAALALPLSRDPAYAEDPNLPFMIWFGLLPAAAKDPSVIVELGKSATSPRLARWSARYLATRIEKDPATIGRFLATEIPAANRPAVLDGITDALAGISSAAEPPGWKSFAASIPDEGSQGKIRKISLIFGDTATLATLRNTVADGKAPMGERQAALDTLIDAKAPDLRPLCESVLSTPPLNGNALRGLSLSDDPAIARALIDHYEAFLPANRGHLIDVLVGRAQWADILLDNIAAGKIPKSALPAFSARRIVSLKNAALTRKLDEVWGTLNESAGEKQKAAARLKAQLTPGVIAKADLGIGRVLFAGLCGACHTLYGEGGKIGPDLTGSGRSNLDYVLENILDPGAVVSTDYRVTTLTLDDGRVLAGAIAAQNERTLALRQPAGEVVVEKSTITRQETSQLSMMPEGLLAAMQPDQVRDLIAYFMHPTQVEPAAGP